MSSRLKDFRKLKKKTVLTIFNIITEKRFTVGHKTRWELANEITEKFMSVDHIRDKVSPSLSSMINEILLKNSVQLELFCLFKNWWNHFKSCETKTEKPCPNDKFRRWATPKGHRAIKFHTKLSKWPSRRRKPLFCWLWDKMDYSKSHEWKAKIKMKNWN